MTEERIVQGEEQSNAYKVRVRSHLPKPRLRRGHEDGCRLAARLVASRYDLEVRQLVDRRRSKHYVTRARHLAMYLAHVVCGLSLSAVGAGFNRDRSTASYACHRVEDARDDPAFDAALADLEISAGVLLELQREEKLA